MLNSKKNIFLLLALFALNANKANAQFFDLTDDNALQEPTGNYHSSVNNINSDRGEVNPDIETSGDEGGFIPENNPDEETTPVTLPVATGFDVFSKNLVNEEKIKEQVKDIKQLDYIGYLDANYDEALWLGVSYKDAENFFANFKDINSIHVRKMMVNMLLAKARAPQTEKSWLALRLKTLISMGKLSDAKLLLKETNTKELSLLENEEINSLFLQANLFEEGSLEFIKKVLDSNPSNLNYKKALLLNLYSKGKISEAKLTFNALKESDSSVAESNFYILFSNLLDNKEIDISKLENLTVFDQYIIALNSSLFKGVNYKELSDQVLLMLVDRTTDLTEKTKFAEILMNQYPYSYNLSNLTAVYSEYKFDLKDLSVPLKYLQKSEDKYANRALLYQSSKIKGLNSTKALALKKLWDSYNEDGLYNIKNVITDKTQEININSSIAWFSIDLLKNQLKQTNIEYSSLKSLYENIDNSYSNVNILNLQIAVEFLRRTSLISVDFDGIQEYKTILKDWFNSNKLDTSENYNYVLKVLTILDALNAPIDDEIWTKLYAKSNLETKAKVNPVWLRLVTSAMQKEEKGKALLLIASKFVNIDEQDIDPQTLANIIASLNFLNMPQDMALIGINAIVK